MTSTGKNTKTEAKSQLKELLEADSENLLADILQLGLQQLMELERDDYIGAEPYERSDQRRSSRNGYKPRQLYTRVGTLHLRVPQADPRRGVLPVDSGALPAQRKGLGGGPG
ncbi:Transposase, Mutator family [Fodinibius roseus]|uniref:Transposase, Mutator family n=1 Tax=Fodinibius roseus TaxID=1194090 RepID=A0A1M5HSR2_9BACT|nr:Transposase, Mutator family [Fodinibius roseus]